MGNLIVQDECINMMPIELNEVVFVDICKKFNALTLANGRILKVNLLVFLFLNFDHVELIKNLIYFFIFFSVINIARDIPQLLP